MANIGKTIERILNIFCSERQKSAINNRKIEEFIKVSMEICTISKLANYQTGTKKILQQY